PLLMVANNSIFLLLNWTHGQSSNVNFLDTLSLVVVWLSDQLSWRPPMAICPVTPTVSRGRKVTTSMRCVLAVFASVILSVPGFAQSTAGRILGTVTDQSGAAVVGANVTVTDLERGISRALTTDAAGAYVAAELQPGKYKIRVAARGFRSVERPSVEIEVATDVRADFSLQPGQVSEIIEVTEDIPLVNTTSATLGGTLSNTEINDLPLNGRNYQNLLQLRPGVIRYPGGGFSTTSANGLRAEDNAYLIDGLYNT